ncbi:MAG: ferritin-like domain-containing protein [Tabrizicola sp.]|nr:ferritin-like domain-containing protein [Tabrizicola sp.]
MKTLAEAFHHTLKDVYFAENALCKALPKMADAVSDEALAQAFRDHEAETREQVETLKKVFETIDAPAEGEKCDAMEGLLKEGEGLMAEATGKALGATMIGIAQAVEHYEIARYGTLRQWAKELGNTRAHDLLSQILDVEKATNAKLTGLAVNAARGA